MSGHAKRVASALALVLACSTFTAGAALAGDNGNGKSDEAPGQLKQAEESQQAATPPAQATQQEAQTPAPAPATQDASAKAPGQTKKASVQSSTSTSTNQEARASGPGVKPSNDTEKWTTCKTGGGTGSSATCSGTHSPKPDSSKQYGNGETAAQIANERGAPAGTTIKGPGNSQPHKVAVCPRKSNRSGGVDVHAVKSYSTAACAEQQQQQQQQQVVPQANVTVTPTVTPTPVTVTPTVVAPPAAGAAGAEVTISQPRAAGKPAPAGGVLGALARVGRGGALPFTGLPLWIAALAAFALLGSGFAVRRAARI